MAFNPAETNNDNISATVLIPIIMSSLWNLRPPNTVKEFKAVIHRCDICDDMIHETPEEVKKEGA